MEQKILIACVGAGYFSQFQYNAWARIKDVEVVAICNRNIENAKAIAEKHAINDLYDNLERMLDEQKPDILDIITPPETHAHYCRAAIDRGITVICQKPFTRSLQEAKKLITYMKENNGTIIIHENFRFQPWYTQIKDVLENGVLGDLYEIHFMLRPGDGQGANAYLLRQPYFQKMERFLVHETASHFIDVFGYLFGGITSVYADLARLNPAIKGEDAGIILFDFANGTRGTFNGNRLIDHKAKNPRLTMGEMRIEGSKANLRLDGDGSIWLREHGSTKENQIEFDWQDNDFGGDCVYLTQRHIADHFLNKKNVTNSAEDYLNVLNIVDHVYKSCETGRKLDVKGTNKNSYIG